ncbi:MAG: energy transducer TonB [Pseudomonadota bacterium]
MINTLLSRSMLFSLVVLVHVAIFWWLMSAPRTTTPPSVPLTIVATLLPSDEPRPQPATPPAPPTPTPPPIQRSPQIAPPVTTPRATESTPQATPLPQPTQENIVTPPTPISPPSEAAPVAAQAPPPTPAPPAPPAPLLPPRFDAAYLNNPTPAYPPGARRLGVQGKVLLRVHVATDGTAAEVQLHKSSGSPALDEAALAAVRKWRFVPARQGTEAVMAWVQVPIEFKLN